MKILVGSVFSDNPRTPIWYNLQIKFLKQTTLEFEHVVFPNCDFKFNDSIVLTKGSKTLREGHVEGLNNLLSYFSFREKDFDCFLLLDSDCFPIKKNWNELLLSKMKMKNLNVAAPLRYENLDSFAHPCAFFFEKTALPNLKFGINSLTNFFGTEFEETSSNCEKFFPLLRSNKINKHFLLFGIYWDIFYHHGAGSRGLIFRSMADYHFNELNVEILENKMFEDLKASPNNYIDKLTGNFLYNKKFY